MGMAAKHKVGSTSSTQVCLLTAIHLLQKELRRDVLTYTRLILCPTTEFTRPCGCTCATTNTDALR